MSGSHTRDVPFGGALWSCRLRHVQCGEQSGDLVVLAQGEGISACTPEMGFVDSAPALWRCFRGPSDTGYRYHRGRGGGLTVRDGGAWWALFVRSRRTRSASLKLAQLLMHLHVSCSTP